MKKQLFLALTLISCASITFAQDSLWQNIKNKVFTKKAFVPLTKMFVGGALITSAVLVGHKDSFTVRKERVLGASLNQGDPVGNLPVWAIERYTLSQVMANLIRGKASFGQKFSKLSYGEIMTHPSVLSRGSFALAALIAGGYLFIDGIIDAVKTNTDDDDSVQHEEKKA